ncbi:hypothetical protein [Shewanella sp. YLB-07]|uniref:hypothetical protein n=1 Tax=Shewanella sp. YLB-07 TaxID=2601268 RepID=UPI00128C751C|nr:hypothetical protein [Shewanella sp. YLB-07]MPY23135.1 hypothetical protein [Shewanella sp. YLB-07]
MKEKVIFIDDEEDSRIIYEDVLQDIYGEEYDVVAIEPEQTISDMVSKLSAITNLVSIVIDEKLQVGLATNYQGSQLVEAIRVLDSKLPLYILTSEISLITPPLGSVEYIIDKNEVERPSYKEQYSILMRRHINSFNDIKTKRAERFDKLLKKSIEKGLTAQEKIEYENLDIVRIKPVLSEECSGDAEELDRQQSLIDEIEQKLKKLIDG